VFIDNYLSVPNNCILIDLEEVECNIIRVRLEGLQEEIDMERFFRLLHVLQSKPKSPSNNQEFYYLLGSSIVFESVDKIKNILAREDDFSISIIIVGFLVAYHHIYEIS
jgi:hypothetical protein